jgi:hypothetical protein
MDTEKAALVVTVVAVSLVILASPWAGAQDNLGDILGSLEGKRLKDLMGQITIDESQLDMIRDLYNDNMGSAPQVRDLLANERINLVIEDVGTFGIVNEDGEMKSLTLGELPDPTLQVSTNLDTVTDLVLGTKQAVDALRDGSIGFVGIGPWNWLRFEIARIMFGIASALGMV